MKRFLAVVVPIALAFGVVVVVACSPSTAHPDTLGDCKSGYGCNPALGIVIGDPNNQVQFADLSATDGSTDGKADGADTGVTPVTDSGADAAVSPDAATD